MSDEGPYADGIPMPHDPRCERLAFHDPATSDCLWRERPCVANWPGCEDGTYDPRCCRFPKSCSVHDVPIPKESA